ncbi:MAG: transcription-repair coupling factor [Candidatus Peribacteraceae bacterium]|nr:transcription-repair coupling factor [Candidatus Peribacteraceae bacterium]
MHPSLLLGRETHRDLAQLLKANKKLTLSGVSNETSKALVTAMLLSFNEHPALFVTGKEERAETLQHWLSFFERQAEILVPPENSEGEIEPEALRGYLRLMSGDTKNTVFIATRDTWDTPFPSYQELSGGRMTFRKGEKLDFTATIEALVERGYDHGADLYLHPGEYRRIGDTFDIFPVQALHPYRIAFSFETVDAIFAVDAADLSKTKDAGETLELFPVTYSHSEPLQAQLSPRTMLILDDQDDIETPAGIPTLHYTAFPESQENHVHLRYLSVLKFYTLTDFLNDVRDKLQQQWSLAVVTKRMEELQGIFREEKIPFTDGGENRHGAVTLLPAQSDDLLPHSIQNPDLQCALLTDREIFSLKKAGKQRSVQKLALDFITSLVPGDYVVHMEHGIGHFEGMTQKEVDGTAREYLELTYAEGDKLFIPVDQADKLSKYVYEEGNEPVLTRLGTQEWKRLMTKTREETQQLAKELLALYAKRAKSKGHAYEDDTDSQRKFDEAFPYQETPGQVKAIEDIKNDMEDEHPMDRLVCGDVGFGKTEVAMRAAFKAAQSGKQVAVIAPITILADQHFKTFTKRMEGFPIRIDMLSRFRSQKQQKATLQKLRKGDIDIVIGTHRLLQDDVQFLNLGLVIIDEEQRFGVKQKEKFKEMRANIDILTLTATPIPRTLNLGLHKLRDISTITTPPPGRLPIITEVRKYSEALVRKAILTEVERGGQIYFLHNRVETIDAFAEKLRGLVPEATFIVGHGQLKADELEARIVDFKDGKYNVLVSSTIIENGIDLPRANTLIVNEAERFGLSQLYQLRGRVGRSNVQAYAYFLYHTQKLHDDARKRLRAIVEACELGSGFQVAMRDLEIRGAGEILGAGQSGNMQTVGVSHYLRMLKSAVEELKSGEKGTEEDITVEILLPFQALIPTYYIPDEQEKISVYQKLAGSEDEVILKEFEEDLHAEYGKPPKEVQNLFAILRLKMACRRAGVVRVKVEESGKDTREVVLTLSSRVTAKEIMQLLRVNSQWRISGSTLRLHEAEIVRAGGKNDVEWMEVLAKQVESLQIKKASSKKKKQE